MNKTVFKLVLAMSIFALLIILSTSVFASSDNRIEIVKPKETTYPIVTIDYYYDADKEVLLSGKMSKEDVVSTLGIVIYEGNPIFSSLGDLVDKDLIISVDYLENVSVSEITYTPYGENITYSQNIPKGLKVVTKEGVNGTIRDIYNVTRLNGVEIDREYLKSGIVSEPINAECLVGQGGTFIDMNGYEVEYSYYVDCTATYYTKDSSPTEWDYYTFIEIPVDETCIAVDPNVIPLKSKVYVAKNTNDEKQIDCGYKLAADIGGGIVGNKIDVYYETESNIDWYFWYHGIINVRVYVLND